MAINREGDAHREQGTREEAKRSIRGYDARPRRGRVEFALKERGRPCEDGASWSWSREIRESVGLWLFGGYCKEILDGVIRCRMLFASNRNESRTADFAVVPDRKRKVLRRAMLCVG
jgi:hypothetical protein